MRLLLARLSAGLRWSTPRRSARLLLQLARAERASYYDLMAAARLCPDVTRQAAYLRHAIDENRHALMFGLRAEQLDPGSARAGREQRVDFEQLYARLGEPRFLAFVHLGERRGRRQLQLYRDELHARGDERGRAMLDAVLVDEARHEASTAQALRGLLGSEHEVRRALWLARAWELARGMRRAGRGLGNALFLAGMWLLYLLLWPLALLLRWRDAANARRV